MDREPIEKAPDCVLKTVEDRMKELDQQIRDYTDMVRQLEAEYAAHAQFMMSFGAGRNLSQKESSDDMAESPQALPEAEGGGNVKSAKDNAC